jgi:serine/threonine protein phosphatase PrpC
LVREHNEDNFVIANLTTGEPSDRDVSLVDAVGDGGLLFAVCDGMGGAAAGEVASQMAVDVLLEAMRRGGYPGERDVLARRLVAAVEEAGRRIFDSAQKERSRRGMGTTATAAVLIDKVLFLAEVGDSRAYLLRSGLLKQLTKDQSLVNQLIEAGHLTEAEAEAFEHSNIILQALGTSETVQVDLTFVELRRGDRLMICSDGLSGLVTTDTLREVLANIDDPSECTAALVKFAEMGGGHDNITVVVIDFQGDDLETPSENDSFGYLQYPLVPSASVAGAFSEEEITEAAKPSVRPNYDSLPPYEPASSASLAGDSNPWLWVSAGLTALLLGAWLLAASDGAGSATANEALPAVSSTVAPAEPAADKPTELARNAAVPVRVFSDVQDAVLLVNGEAQGQLSGGQQGHAMELAPGAYRFEARSHGNIAAVEVVTVQKDAQTPVDVYLRLPSGTNEPGRNAAGTVAGGATPALAADKPADGTLLAEPVPGTGADKTGKPVAAPAAAAEPLAEGKAVVASKPVATTKPVTPAANVKPRAPAVATAPTARTKKAEPSTTSPAQAGAQPSAAAAAAPKVVTTPASATGAQGTRAAEPPAAEKPANPIPENPF